MSRTALAALNASNPNQIADANKIVLAGTSLSRVSRRIRAVVASHILVLPDDAKACAVLAAWSAAGTLTGRLTPVIQGASVTTGLVGINPVGNILFATADAVTLAEVDYTPYEGDVVTETIPVAAGGVGTPLQSKIASLLLSATLIGATSPGAKTVVARGATPSAGQAAVGVTGTIVFNSTDATAAGTALVTYIAQPGVGAALPGLAARLATAVEF